MRVLIVEDEHISAEKLERQLLQADPSAIIVAKLESVAETKRWLTENSCDLIFLDIHLSDGLSFDIFDGRDAPAPVIFTTAYDEYAIRAFKLNSIDYLLKPIGKQDLALALAKFDRMSSPLLDEKELVTLAKSIENKVEKQYQRSMLISSGEKIIRITLSDISYFFADGKYVFAVIGSGSQYIIDTPLDKLQDQIDPDQFYRANRKFIVNIKAITEMTVWSKSRIKLQLQPPFPEDIIISTEKTKHFKEWLQESKQ